MQFVLTREHRYWWPVTVTFPHDDPAKAGEIVQQTFKMQFVAMPQDEAAALADEIAALPPSERAKREHDHIIAVSCNWTDIVDADKSPVPFSEEALREALQSSFFRIAIYRAVAESLRGEAARKGN